MVRIISLLTSISNLLISPEKFRLLSKHEVCQISLTKTRSNQPSQLFSLFRRSKNEITIGLAMFGLCAKVMGNFMKTAESTKSTPKMRCRLICVVAVLFKGHVCTNYFFILFNLAYHLVICYLRDKCFFL